MFSAGLDAINSVNDIEFVVHRIHSHTLTVTYITRWKNNEKKKTQQVI